ncbi:D-glycero-beta-D-manno-heptose-7-phosphate kinase [Myxococcota bacterium]
MLDAVTTKKLADCIRAKFSRPRVVVVGDIMLDQYIIGEVARVSPEAPVPIVQERLRQLRLGGAANVAANLVELGAEVSLVGLVGEDDQADVLLALLEEQGITGSGVLRDGSRPTTVKTRIISDRQQLLRLDRESHDPPSEELQRTLREQVVDLLTDAKAVIISDYSKGLITPTLSQAVIFASHSAQIPSLVDPKGEDYSHYAGASLLAPNLAELSQVAGHSLLVENQVIKAAEELLRQHSFSMIAVTRGADGITFVDSSGPTHYPTVAREVFDVSGAGDAVIAACCVSLTAGFVPDEIMPFANLAAGTVVTKVGTVPVVSDEILRVLGQDTNKEGKLCSQKEAFRRVEQWRSKGERIVFTNGCFDLLHVGHTTLLEAARRLGDKLVVAVNSDTSVRGLKGEERPINKEENRVKVLASLSCVDMVVIFEEATPLDLIVALRPDVLCKGSDYHAQDVVGAKEIRTWGGEVRLLDLVPGQSSTRLAEEMQRRGC